MKLAGGLVLALISSFALNWGWLVQHGAARDMPPLVPRRPLHSVRILLADRLWLAGVGAGIGGWLVYLAALALAPLSLVQATSAGGVGLLALLARRRGDVLERLDWAAVWLAAGGLVLIGSSVAGGAVHGTAPAPRLLALWLGVSGLVALVTFLPRAGIAGGTLFAAGDVATKAATFGGLWFLLAPVLLLAHILGFVSLQLGFQRGSALETAGTASLLTNAIPIAGGVVLFHEHVPHGLLGVLRIGGFVLVVLAAGILGRRQEPAPSDPAEAMPTGR